jgi:hypothetical protein
MQEAVGSNKVHALEDDQTDENPDQPTASDAY